MFVDECVIVYYSLMRAFRSPPGKWQAPAVGWAEGSALWVTGVWHAVPSGLWLSTIVLRILLIFPVHKARKEAVP